jgi:TIR domain
VQPQARTLIVSERIFISYRRADTQGWAGRLGDALARAFGTEPLFFDLESIKPGDDFIDGIEKAVGSAGVVLALIGPNWLTAAHQDGSRRLDDPDDLVRLEIAAALSHGVRVIPVLLGAAAMPQASGLPADLASLPRRQAHEVTDKRWDFDIDRLFDAIENTTGLKRLASSPAAGACDGNAISVGASATLEGVEIGDVAGIKVEGAMVPSAVDSPIDVLKGARVKNSKLGDITGITIKPGCKDEK